MFKLGVLLMCLWLQCVLAAEPIREIAEVRRLDSKRAALELPVEIEAQVLNRPGSGHGLFVHDAFTGIYVSLKLPLRLKVKPKPGDVIRVVGVTNEGHFTPHIDAREITVLRHDPLPEPLKVDRVSLYDPEMDCRWVTLDGVVIDTVRTGLVQSLRLACFGRIVSIVLPHSAEVEKSANGIINQAVKVRGVAATQWNARRQMTGRTIRVRSFEDIIPIVEMSDEPPLVEIDQLLQVGTRALEAKRVRGVVVFSNGKQLYLQGPGGALLVHLKSEANWEHGSYLEVTGMIEVNPFSPSIRSWKVEEVGEKRVVSSLPIKLETVPYPISWNNALVAIEVDLIDVRRSDTGFVLQCENNGHFFGASLPGFAEELEVGSKLKLTGICELKASQSRAHFYAADGISLKMRDGGDAEVIARPSWWTAERILGGFAIAAAVAFFSLLWVASLRSRVAEQMDVIRHQVEREARHKERERLARDLHDSLEQNIVGITRQLSTASRNARNGKVEGMNDALFLAHRMAEHCQRESREAIHDLRQNHRTRLDSQWHDELLMTEAEARGAKVEFETEGEPRSREVGFGQQISKIVREAVYNSLRHGEAKLVKVSYRELPEGLIVEIKDDGCGFDPSIPPERGHFGLYGMKERAQHMSGELQVDSSPGKGTVVTLTVPVSQESQITN